MIPMEFMSSFFDINATERLLVRDKDTRHLFGPSILLLTSIKSFTIKNPKLL